MEAKLEKRPMPPSRKGSHWSDEQRRKFIASMPNGKPWNWNGGISKKWRPDICVVEKAIKKKLPQKAEIHHFPNKRNFTNIVICENRLYHHLLHIRYRALKLCGNVHYRKCVYCKEYDDPKNLYISEPTRNHHSECANRYNKSILQRGKNNG